MEVFAGLKLALGSRCCSSDDNYFRERLKVNSLVCTLCHTHTHTYRRRDSPTPHAGDLEAPLLHLLVGQLDVEVELVVAGADDHLATLLREVGDTGVKLDVAVIFQSLTKMNELRERTTRLCWNLVREGASAL